MSRILGRAKPTGISSYWKEFFVSFMMRVILRFRKRTKEEVVKAEERKVNGVLDEANANGLGGMLLMVRSIISSCSRMHLGDKHVL